MTGSQREGQLLDDGRSGVAERLAADGDRLHVLAVGRAADQCCDALEAGGAVRRAELSLRRKALHDGVDDEVEAEVALLDSGLLGVVEHEFGRAGRLHAREGELDGGQGDFAEQGGDILGRRLEAHFEAQRVDTGVEDLERLGIGLLGLLYLQGLVYAPAVVRPRTSYIGELSCLRA